MKNTKWIYPAQEKIKTYLQEKFGGNYRCEFQDICKYVAYEMYQCWLPKEEGKPQVQERVIFVIHKSINKNSPAVIETMYRKDEHTMQYFEK